MRSVLQPTCTTPSSQPRITSCLPILNLKGLSLSRDESNLRPSVREPVDKEMEKGTESAANVHSFILWVKNPATEHSEHAQHNRICHEENSCCRNICRPDNDGKILALCAANIQDEETVFITFRKNTGNTNTSPKLVWHPSSLLVCILRTQMKGFQGSQK